MPPKVGSRGSRRAADRSAAPKAKKKAAERAEADRARGAGGVAEVADGFEVRKSRRVRKHKIDRAGVVPAAAAAAEPLLPGDERPYSDINTIASDNNLVTPLFPDILVDPDGPDSYNASMMGAIEAARRFIVVEGYDLNREDFVDALIAKAKEGVEVAVLFDPVNSAREKKKGELLDKMRAAKLPNLTVAEYGLVPHQTKSGFEQILHVKKVITDTPDGSLCEHSGGINFSPNSINNLDFGWRTEGLGVFDSLRHVVGHWQTSTGAFPIALENLPDWNEVEALVAKKLEKAKVPPVEVEIASAGKLPMEAPRKYTKAKLMERAQLGKKIIISAKDAQKPGVQKNLQMAVHNGSRVWVIKPDLDEEAAEAFKPVEKEMKKAGLRVFHEDDVILEDSYFELVCRELDVAIEEKAPIAIAAFALSHRDIIERLIAAHEAGSDVRVIVDDLQIDGNLINKKAMAQLSAAGVPVRAVDKEVKSAIAKDWGGDENHLKLHAKYLGIGNDRVLGGSANFSSNGMTNNVEDGRLIRSEAVGTKVRATLFDPLWEVSKPIEPFPLVPDEARIPILDRVPVGTPIEDITFVVMDFETTGFVAKYDDRILQMSARAVKLRKDGSVEVLGDHNQVVDPGRNLMGHAFSIPKQIAGIVGINNKNLEERGAVRMRQAMPAFVDFIRTHAENGPVVLAGQNLPFDLRFFDHTMSREGLGVESDDGLVHYTLDAPYVDCIDVSERIHPDVDSHNLDAHMERYGIPHDPELPRHDAFADVVYTAASLGQLAAASGAKVLGDLLPPDLVQLDGARELYSSARKNAQALHQLSFNEKGKLQMEVRDPRNGQLGGARRVYDMQVTGRKNGRLEVAVTTGTKDKAVVTKGWIDEAGLEFRSGGRFYNKMREEGAELLKPQVVTP